MPLSSMTGFARAQGQHDDRAWSWEARSVNGRGLEIRCRFPFGLESLEIPVRERISRRFRRGNISATLTVVRTGGSASVRINTEVLERVLALVPVLEQRLAVSRPPSVDGLLGLRGVIEPVDEELSEEARAAFEAALLGGLDAVIEALAAMRADEGARLTPILGAHLDRIAALSAAGADLASSQTDAVFARLKEQIEALLSEVPSLPEERLAQEAALLAAKSDPREELDRLKAHVDAARELVAGSGSVGRRLDFLCQELNREANTLCSKSANVDLTRIGLDLKAAIEQFREQVQNIE